MGTLWILDYVFPTAILKLNMVICHERVTYLCAVLDSFQNGGEVGAILGAVLPALSHDPIT